ncbi:MAG: hypothetical protein K6F65_00060 [Lachnospiraceae bacterium]|nr:hypothetical protein [Lachnospiraceae bacterium]
MLFFALYTVLSLAGCSNTSADEDLVILYGEEETAEVAGDLPVEYADVVKTQSISVRYSAAVTVDLAFDVERAKIDSVLVTNGEEVKRGQLLISLVSNTDIEAERENILYTIERLELQKARTLDQKEHDITLARFNIAMDDKLGGDEKKQAEKEALEEIDKNYYYTLQDFDDKIAIQYLRLEYLEKGNVDHNIYAPMDGIVEYLREGLEGTTTVIGKTVITLKDPDDMYFFASDPLAATYLEGMESVIITPNGSSGVRYEAVPEPQGEGNGLKFVLIGDSATESIAEGTNGYIVIELGRRDNVLSVPKAAVHTAGEKTYVYVVDEDGYRRYREIVIGLEGDDRTEIISGLEAGERVAVNF